METHYAYIVGPTGRDIVTKTFNLVGVSTEERRRLIGELAENHGESLARLPSNFARDGELINLEELTCFVNGE